MKNILQFLQQAGTLKEIPRAGWVKREIREPESVADHSYRTALMALLLAEPPLDREKCVAMAIVHDLPEVTVGDITPMDGISPAEKKEREHEAMRNLAADLPNGPELMALWEEAEEKKTPEALFVHQLDVLERLLQAFAYEATGEMDATPFTAEIEKYLSHPALRQIAEEAERNRTKR